jgi:steroid delta-isomerase-like uncharacterized protein
MSAQENAALARKVYQLFSENRIDEALPLVTEDVEVVLVPFGQTYHGRQGFANFMTGYKDAFPDVAITVVNQVATEEQVVTEFTAKGTHTGPLLTPAGEIPPTGKTVDFTACEVWKVRDGRLASLHNYQDVASLMRQLGLFS